MKAMLGPVPGRARLEQGLVEGWLTAGTGAPLSAFKPPKAQRSIRQVLHEDRGA